LRIQFLGGDPKLRKRAMRCAAQWFAHANLHYEVVAPGAKTPGDIRISFDKHGSWSCLGTTAKSASTSEPTMNLGEVRMDTPEPEFQRVVLKEFGHALGLLQEHQNPYSDIPWNREVVLRELGGPPNNWSKEMVEQNIFNRSVPVSPPYRDFDRHSVMTHNFPADWLLSGQAIISGTKLSASDKKFIRELYPRVTSSSERVRPKTAPPSKRPAFRK
jgi:serralysin